MSCAEACGQELARFKVPDVWATVSELPTNAMGKVIRTDLVGLLAAAEAEAEPNMGLMSMEVDAAMSAPAGGRTAIVTGGSGGSAGRARRPCWSAAMTSF